MARVCRIACLAAVIACGWTPGAWADGPVGQDPSSNFPVTTVPSACSTDPTGATCVGAAVADLDAARAALGQAPYTLPTNFTSLSGAEQGFVLANLDRVLYGLPAIPGMTAALSSDAANGVARDTDPRPSDPNFNYFTSNWAGGFYNMPLAYEAWMYDDGQGSGNLDCTSDNSTGCWGHRHDVLWSFDGANPLAMGVAAGSDPAGSSGYAMLLGEGDQGYEPVYTYTWAQAVAAGANAGASGPAATGGATGSSGSRSTPTATTKPASPRVGVRRRGTGVAARLTILSIRVRGHRVSVRFAAPASASLRCTLSRDAANHWVSTSAMACTRSQVYSNLRSGRYRLRVFTNTGSVTAYLRVR